MIRNSIIILLSFFILTANSQDTISEVKWKKPFVYTGLATGYATSLIILNEAWYKHEERSSFHFFNDGNEWNQMDKVGHVYTTWQFADGVYESLKWGGVDEKKAAIQSAVFGIGILTSYEVMDAFSAQWGFSTWDLVANTTGAGLWLTQQLLWQEQKIKLKFSSHLTDYALIRPNLMGKTIPQRILKDYNGQSYWLSVPFQLFDESTFFPEWLNFAVGYGADRMFTGRPGQAYEYQNQFYYDQNDRIRQFYLSLDVDFTKIPTNKKWLKIVLRGLNAFKVPAPAIMLDSEGKFKGYYLYW